MIVLCVENVCLELATPRFVVMCDCVIVGKRSRIRLESSQSSCKVMCLYIVDFNVCVVFIVRFT